MTTGRYTMEEILLDDNVALKDGTMGTVRAKTGGVLEISTEQGPQRADARSVATIAGATLSRSEAKPCLTPDCPRPGINFAGYCCARCARHYHYGHILLHSERCEIITLAQQG